jgi:hypothetical protein
MRSRRGLAFSLAVLALGQILLMKPCLSQTADASALAGKWTYRSFHNSPALIGDDGDKALRLIFAEAEFTFTAPSANEIVGAIDWPGGGLDLTGTVQPGTATSPLILQMTGLGRAGTGTEGWQYDYHAHLAHTWPNGIGQVPALVGSVLRAKPHGAAAAGYSASFVAVKQP